MRSAKDTALELFARADLGAVDWEVAARALAAVVKGKPKTATRTGYTSKAFKGLTVIRWMRCSEGHEFNGAGCKVCPYCTTRRHALMPRAAPGFLPSVSPHRGWDTPWNAA